MRYIDTVNRNEFVVGYSGAMNENILADDGSNCFFHSIPQYKVIVWTVGQLPTLRDMTQEEIENSVPPPQ